MRCVLPAKKLVEAQEHGLEGILHSKNTKTLSCRFLTAFSFDSVAIGSVEIGILLQIRLQKLNQSLRRDNAYHMTDISATYNWQQAGASSQISRWI